MRNLLYIDPFCNNGHINYNKLYVNIFLEYNLHVDLILKEGYINKLGLPSKLLRLELPKKYYPNKTGKLISRIYLFKILLFIKNNINLECYDYVIFSGYEEITFYFTNIAKNSFLINHDNVSGLKNGIKRFFNKRISSKNTHIVFAEFIKNRLAHFDINKMIVVSLGIFPPYKIDRFKIKSILKSIDNRIDTEKYKYIIFAPAGSKYGDNFINMLLSNGVFLDYLYKKRILFIVKDKLLNSHNDNVLIINKILSDLQYQSLFIQSSAILIQYPASFDYRVSGIFMECLSNNKKCLLSDIKGFRAFEDHFNYDPFYINADGLIDKIDRMVLSENINQPIYQKLTKLTPSFDQIILD